MRQTMASNESSQTLGEAVPDESLQQLRLDDIEPILVLSTRMDEQELMAIEQGLIASEAPLTYDIKEAKLFIGKVSQKRRAALELRIRDVFTEEMAPTYAELVESGSYQSNQSASTAARKRRRSPLSNPEVEERAIEIDLTRDSTIASDSAASQPLNHDSNPKGKQASGVDKDVVRVITSEWFFDSLRAHRRLPFHRYLVYTGRRVKQADSNFSNSTRGLPRSTSSVREYSSQSRSTKSDTILARARNEAEPITPSQVSRKRFHGALEQRDRESIYASTTQTIHRFGMSVSDGVAPLLAQTTTEDDLDIKHDIPDPPDWVKKKYKYACQRSTPANKPNEKFVRLLKAIRITRELTGDEIGIRAYSTAIAALSAYPYTLTSPREITALPGCSDKIAAIFAEWKNNDERDVEAVREANSNPRLQVLKLFYGIWGVGAATAREFYNRGWRDLDDVVEYGWNIISRVQQIGVKFYDEFQEKILRVEVEEIRAVVHRHAQRVMGEPDGVRTTIVGGYRRGKAESGDVDLMVSHLDDGRTFETVDDIAESLFEEGWVTHSLGTTHSNSRRDEQTLPYKGPGAGRGFDSLDKVMVVWQDPRYEEKDAVDGRNPNVHRRVDIIISPWRTIGCAVLGWSAGTTFERDLRRYAKQVKKWKFDSSGIRDRVTGDIVDVEAIGGRAETIEEAERKVFAGLGLEYREPWERCTG